MKAKGIIDGTYIRIAGTTRHVEDYQLKELILEGEGRSYDSDPCKGLVALDEEIGQLCKDMKAVALQNSVTEAQKASVKAITKNTLLSWGILTDKDGIIVPTNAFALLTGKKKGNPPIQCGIFKGTDRAYIADRREFDGFILEQLNASFQYVLEKINMGMTIKGIYRQDRYELPVDSVRELIANAVVHRSYLNYGSIQATTPDRSF